MWLVVFSVFCLLAGLLVGRFFPNAKFWDWIDAPYYLLAIIGVLLFYFDNASLRGIPSLEKRQAEEIEEFKEIQVRLPSVDMQFSGRELVRSGGELLTIISRTDTACRESLANLPFCHVVKDFAPITIPGERHLLSYEKPKDLGTICGVASEIFVELAEDSSLSSYLMRPLADHFFQGIEKGFYSSELENVRVYIEDLKPVLDNEVQKMIATLSFSKEDKALMNPIYAAEIRYGLMVLHAFEVCLRAPEGIRSGKYADWVEVSQAKQNEIDQYDIILLKARLDAQKTGPIGMFMISQWPFVIIFALILKLAKIARTRKQPMSGGI